MAEAPVFPIPNVEFVLDDPNATAPVYGSKRAAGMDLAACEDGDICAKSQQIIDTGIIFAIPEHWEGAVRSRSGLCVRAKLDVPTGTIDRYPLLEK